MQHPLKTTVAPASFRELSLRKKKPSHLIGREHSDSLRGQQHGCQAHGFFTPERFYWCWPSFFSQAAEGERLPLNHNFTKLINHLPITHCLVLNGAEITSKYITVLMLVLIKLMKCCVLLPQSVVQVATLQLLVRFTVNHTK